MKKTLLPLLLFLVILKGPAQSVWQAYEPALPDVVGTFDLRISPIDHNVAWAVCHKYNVTNNAYDWVPMDSMVFAKTSDGGQTWQGGTIPMGIEPYANSICALDANTAWATGLDIDFKSYLLQTTDGGQTWQPRLQEGYVGATSYVNAVHFFDAQHGVVIGDPAESDTEPTPFFEIYTTSDGGQNWTRVNSSILSALPNEYGIDHLFDVQGDTVWFGTVDLNNNTPLRMFRSVDKGTTWTVANSSAHWPFSFADGQYGIGMFQVSNIQASLTLTTDGGETWTALPLLNQGYISSLAIVPQSRYIVAVARTNNVVGPFNTLLSTDLGQTWTEIGDGSELAGNATFASPTIGYAGEWQPANHPTRMYAWAGDPLSGLLSGKALDAEVEIFPNPTSGFVRANVKTAQATDFLLLVNDAQGRLVQRQLFEKTNQVNATLDVQGWAPGLYSVTVSTRTGSLTRKVVKQ